jgi:hypothetical protein
MSVFTTRALLNSVGVSQSRATSGAVAINWILKVKCSFHCWCCYPVLSVIDYCLTVLSFSVTTGWRWACRKNAFCTSREEIRLWPKAGAIFDTKWFAAVLHLFCSVSVDSSKSKFATAPLFWRSHDGTGSWNRVSYCSIPSTFPAVGLHGKCCQGLTLCLTATIYGSNTTY